MRLNLFLLVLCASMLLPTVYADTNITDLCVTDITLSDQPVVGDVIDVSSKIVNNGSSALADVSFFVSFANKTIIESAHPYPDDGQYNCVKTWNLTHQGALRMRTHFETIELYYAKGTKDHIIVKDAGGTVVADYHYPDCPTQVGVHCKENVWSPYVEGDTIIIELHIGKNRRKWTDGFYIDQYEYSTCFHAEQISFGVTDERDVAASWTVPDKNCNLTVAVDRLNETAESNETNNEMTKEVRPKCLSDLAVTDLSFNPPHPIPGDNVTASVRIENLGTDAPPFEVQLLIDHTFFSSTRAAGLSSGEIVNVDINWIADAGCHNITVAVATALDELDESNNQATARLCTRMPDLIVTNLTITPFSPTSGDETNISVHVTNNGSLTADAVLSISDGGAVPYSMESAHYVPDTDQNLTITHPGARWLQIHFSRLGIIGDGAYVEICDKNNTPIITYRYADVSKKDFADITSPRIYGDLVRVRFVADDPCYGICIDEYEYFARELCNKTLPLDPGGHAGITTCWNATPSGPHNITAMIDPDDAFLEEDETNNNLSMEVLVRGPDLCVLELFPDSTDIADGDTVTLTAVVANLGVLTASAVVGIEVDHVLIDTVTVTLVPGESTEIETAYQATAGLHTISVLADYDHLVPETDETNNTKEISVMVSGAELSVSDITLDPPRPLDLDRVTLRSSLANIGTWQIDSTVAFYDCTFIHAYNPADVCSDDDQTITITSPGAACMGIHITHITTRIEILGAAACTQPGWVWVSGDTLCMRIETGMYDLVQADFFAGDMIASQAVSLSANESTELSADWIATAGNHTIAVFAGMYGTIGVETTDSAAVAMVWVQPTMDFAIVNVDLDRLHPYDGDLVNITARIRNQGNRAGSVGVNISEHQTMNHTSPGYGGVQIISHAGEDVRVHFKELKVPGTTRVDITSENGRLLHSYNYHNVDSESVWSPWFSERTIKIVSIGGTIDYPVSAAIDRYECRNMLCDAQLSLDVNETENITATWLATTGDHEFVVMLDSTGDLYEGNNIINEHVYIYPSRDPAVVNLAIDPEDPKNGDEVTISATVANHGLKPSECTVEVWDYRDERRTIETQHTFEDGKRYSHSWTISHPGADFIGVHFTTISTNTGGDQSLLMYDRDGILIADYSYVTKSDSWVWANGDALVIDFEYKNGPSPYGFLVDKYGYKKMLNSTAVSLDVGEIKQVAARWGATTGEHVIEGRVDPDDVLKEMNENNNILNRTIDVRGPDLAALDITFKNDALNAVIENIGTCGTCDVLVCFVTDADKSIDSGWLGYGYQKEITRTISHPDAGRMRVHIEDMRMNGYLYIKDRNEDIAAIYSGSQSDLWTPWVHGNRIVIEAHAEDNPLSYFKIDAYEYGFGSETVDFDVDEKKEIPIIWAVECGNLTVIVDPDNTIIEDDEDNNEFSKRLGPDIFIDPRSIPAIWERYYEKKESNPYGMGWSPKYPSINHECTISATIENKGMIPTGEFEVSLFVNDSVVEKKVDSTMISLDPNEKETIDFSWTPDTNGTFDVSVRADCDDRVWELDESNNNHTRDIEIYKHGYAGGSLSAYDSGDVNGSMIFSLGDSKHLESGKESQLTVNFVNAIPSDARIVLGRLYLYWGFGHTGDWIDETAEPASLEADMMFNGKVLSVDREYIDVATNYAHGVYCYDVTDFVSGTDAATMTRNGPRDGTEYKSSIHGMGLLILYEDGSGLTKYWINEGCNILYSKELGSGLTPEECTVGALFEGEIDITMVTATLYTALPYANDGLNRLYFNDERWDGAWTKYEGSSKIALGEKDVTDHLEHEDNLAGIQDRGDFMIVANAFLTLRYAPDLTVSEISKPYAAVVGKEYLINASVSNIANGNVGRFNVTFSVNGDIRKTVVIPGLAAGESMNASFLWHSPPTVGVFERIDVEVDPEDHVAEWDEDNNERQIVITVVESGTGDAPGPGGSGGGSGGGISGSENVEGYLMKGTAFGTKGGGTGGEFSLLDYLIRSGLSLAGVIIFISGYLCERRMCGQGV